MITGFTAGTVGLAAEPVSGGASTPMVVLGAGMYVHGADNTAAGLRQIWSGEVRYTVTSDIITGATGDRMYGEIGNVLIDLGTGVAASAKMASSAYRLPKVGQEVGQLAIMEPRIFIRPEERKLQHMFSKGRSEDFGVYGNWNPANGELFWSAIEAHIRSSAVTPVRGTYRGTQQVIHYYDKVTKLDVAVDLEGNVVMAWKLSEEQWKCLKNPAIRNVQ
jgi:Colicin D.